jgi:hypothetical protein
VCQDDADPGYFSAIWEFPGGDVEDVFVAFDDGRVDVCAFNVRTPLLYRLAWGMGLAP